MTIDTKSGGAKETDDLLDVAIIGAGFSGICMGVKLRAAGMTNFKIFEKTGGVSGTWSDNTYPGAACDVPSHLYCYSFEPNPSWSRAFSPQPEIQAYAERCVDKYGIRPHIQNHTEICLASFSEQKGAWLLTDSNGRNYRARCVVNGVGGLNQPYIPDIPGLDKFEGTWFHSARWNHEYDLTGKRVAVIGSAASAIQIVPNIAHDVERLFLFQRTANYIVPRKDRVYSPRQKRIFRSFPFTLRLLRWWVFWRLNMHYPLFRQNSWLGDRAGKIALRDMRRKITDPKLHEKLTPKYPIGCKRILLSDDFYPALNRDNVDLVTEGVNAITKDGVKLDDGSVKHVDAIILATGFKAFDFLHSLDFVGLADRRLSQAWEHGKEAHRGVAVAGFPNLFFLLGPNTALGHNSIIFMIEQQVNYIVKCIRKLGRNTYIDAKPSPMHAYNERIQQAFKNTVWTADCPSWYKAPDGRIPTLWPYNTVRYWRWMFKPKWSEYEIKPAGDADAAS